MISEILMVIASSLGGAGCMYVFFGRPLASRLTALETKYEEAMPQLSAAWDQHIALLENNPGTDDAGESDDAAENRPASAPRTPPGQKIPPMDPGIEYALIKNSEAILLAKQNILIGRVRESLTPRQAAVRWIQGTVFKDKYDHFFLVTSGRPVCIYRDGQEVAVTALKPLAEFDGGKLDLLVTPAELRAKHLIT